MKKKYLHEHRLVELFGMGSWQEDREMYSKEQVDDHLELFRQRVQSDMDVDPDAPTLIEIQKVLKELEPDGWSEQLIKRHIIKRSTITSEELLSDIYAMADLHVFAQKTEAAMKVGVTIAEKILSSPITTSIAASIILGTIGATSTGILLLISVVWVLAILASTLGLAPAIADAADELFPSALSKEEKLKAITGPSPIVRYLPFSPELEDLMSPAFFEAIVEELEKRPGQQWTVEHFSNWAIKEICQNNPEALGGKCTTVMTPSGRKPAYRNWVDWSAMHNELYSLRIPIMHKDVIATASKRWFGNVKDMILLGIDKFRNQEEQ